MNASGDLLRVHTSPALLRSRRERREEQAMEAHVGNRTMRELFELSSKG